MEPQYIGEYRVVRKLGSGGMGEVYLVEHPRLPRRDAIKLLAPQFSGDEQFAARFRREADVLAGLHHPNIVMIHDRGEHEGRLWLAMEYVDGADAAKVLREHGRLRPEVVADVVEKVGSALDTAWEDRGLTHRDIKPANVLLAFRSGRLGTVKLADFGIAKTHDDAGSLTGTGVAIGTMAYLSPEGFEGQPADNRSDLYSLACMAFELLTGTTPYPGRSPSAVMMAHLTAPPPDPAQRVPGLPHDLAEVFRIALAKRPDDRYQSGADFAAAFSAALASAPSTPTNGPHEQSTRIRQAAPGQRYEPTMISGPQTPPPVSSPVFTPDPPPAVRPARRGGAGVLAALLALVAVLLVAALGYLWLSFGTKTQTTPAVPAAAPEATVTVAGTTTETDTDTAAAVTPVAQTPTVPGTDQFGFVGSPARCAGGEQLVLVMRTSGAKGGSFVAICSSGGGYVYHGAHVDDVSGISLPAVRSGDGFVATNSSGGSTYTYRVDPSSGLVVSGPDGVELAEPVASVWPQ